MRSTIAGPPYVYSSSTLDGPSSAADGWTSFSEFMMLPDGQTDLSPGFDNDDKSDDVNDYGNYLQDDLQPTVDPAQPDDDLEDSAPATIEPLKEESPQPPVPPALLENKPTKKPTVSIDPYAESFLQESLGPEKWTTFSARLFERRLTGPRGKTAKKLAAAATASGGVETTSSVIDFLCKAEAVKEVLRVYVPHPYNPHKTLSHAFSKSPNGRVTLSRSTVLALSGWSNTQFSYWARRSEAIGVLAYHDRRLKAVANTLANRLRGTKVQDEIGAVEGVTGKGLDVIIDEVKDRTGASPFIHGKHSSLDAFSITETLPDGTTADPEAPWTEYSAGATAQYIPSTFTQVAEEPNAEDGAQMQYYLSSMEFGGGANLQESAELDASPGSAYASPDPTPTTIDPTATSLSVAKPTPKRGRPRGAKGSKATGTNGKGKAPVKRKASGDSDDSGTTRKRAKTGASLGDS